MTSHPWRSDWVFMGEQGFSTGEREGFDGSPGCSVSLKRKTALDLLDVPGPAWQ
ncbi:hypothetical protein M407DRAFT_242845 [Tulasnella calospora MUT 4182]|uniref:Uncharacterized protein n=1 Tax=Tulasnella calospora MUT 4182 TaxID=1051891 RepID=A0A0C3QDC6_9AGAM|nr:hypothetical protein M407DRAFT_245516 [Tulasnella calospora MUT 4182]KIO22993.1 hypothetical protein M407DRAFT_244954 [Tulasnella calospora MUT 4182]KIO28940.1 hypothetical protein M407DRAFT_242845 [Tulasnella calospora MUT 4182]